MKCILKAFCDDCNAELKYSGWQKPMFPPLEIHFCPNCKLEYWISDAIYPQTIRCQPYGAEILAAPHHEMGAQTQTDGGEE